jgi:hypothetical protein
VAVRAADASSEGARMNSEQRRTMQIVVGASLILSFLLLGAFFVGTRWQVSNHKQLATPESPNALAFDPLLKTLSVDKSSRDRLLEAEFKVSTTVKGIPSVCTSTFAALFVYAAGTDPTGRSVSLVDPDDWEHFQYGDALREGRVSFRRLLLAGTAGNECFIYYQHGGGIGPSYCLAILDNATTRPLFVGESNGGDPLMQAQTLEDLRTLLRRGAFQDTGMRC